MNPQDKQASFGPLIGIIVIIVLLVVGGLYFWGKQAIVETDTPVNTLSSSEEINAMEAELAATSSDDNFDFSEIEAELQ